MSDISPLQLCFATNDPIIHLNANNRVGKPTWDAGTNKISAFEGTFWQSPQRQSRKPARAVTPCCALSGSSLVGITSCSCSMNLGTASHPSGISRFFLKHSKVGWGLSLTERRGAFHLPDGSTSPCQGSTHSWPAPPQTGQLFKQLSVSFLSAASIKGSIGHFDNQIQPAHSFFRSIKKPEIENLSHQITKVITSNTEADFWQSWVTGLSWREIWCLPLYRCLVHPAVSSNRLIRHCSWHTCHLQSCPSSCVYT